MIKAYDELKMKSEILVEVLGLKGLLLFLGSLIAYVILTLTLNYAYG